MARSLLVLALAACFVALVSTSVQADLPIHCLNAQIAGEWTFSLDQGGHEPHSSTSLSQVACGYSQPDRNADHFLRPSILVGITELKLSLREPNIVVDEQGKQGTWTMVYDEGFEVTLADGRRFFAYSKYVPNQGTSLSSDKLAGYTSHCDETMVGWYHDAANRNWGCYRGVQTKAANAWTSSVTRTRDDGVDVAPVVSPNALLEEFTRVLHRDTHDEEIDAAEQAAHELEAIDAAADNAEAEEGIFLEEDAEVETEADSAESLDLEVAFGAVPHPRSHVATELPELDDTVLFEPDHVFIERHNANARNTWKAGTHEQFHKKPVKEMLKMLGMKRYNKDSLAAHLNKKQQSTTAVANAPVKSTKRRSAGGASLRKKNGAAAKAKQRGTGGKRAQAKVLDAPRQPIQDTRDDDVKYADLPKHWDWSSRNGVSYDTEIRNQGSCGSCYAMATISAIESRYRVASRLTFRPIISPQEVVSCSFYNQGCEGGYPFLVGKHGAEFGMTQAECHPYTARNSECGAPQSQGIAPSSCALKPRLAMHNYSYGGGYMGGCSEVAMMREIYANGPVMVAFQAPPDLFYYTGGIYTGPSPKEEKQGVNGVNVWQQTNHAVVAVGWGTDAKTGMKYWKLKTTWGARWGEGGYFRIRRGTNECGVESMATKVDVLLPKDVDVPPNAPNPYAEEENKGAPPAASKHRLMQHRHEHAAAHRRSLPQSPVRRRHMLPASAIEYD